MTESEVKQDAKGKTKEGDIEGCGMSEGGSWVKWVGMQGYTVSYTVQNESTITFFWGGVAGGNQAQHTHPFACSQKTHVELLRHVTVCLHHHFGW